jgi:hypothetical protein
VEDPASWGWSEALIGEVGGSLDVDPYWRVKFPINGRVRAGGSLEAVHLGIFAEPFLTWVLDGSKTIESRFSIHRRAPFGVVTAGDILLLKHCGGPVVGVAEVGPVWDYLLDASAWKSIRSRFGKALRIEDPGFWRQKASACYATLMKLERVTQLESLTCGKRDRRGWVVLRPRRSSKNSDAGSTPVTKR